MVSSRDQPYILQHYTEKNMVEAVKYYLDMAGGTRKNAVNTVKEIFLPEYACENWTNAAAEKYDMKFMSTILDITDDPEEHSSACAGIKYRLKMFLG